MIFDNLDLCEIGYVQKIHGLRGHLNIRILEDFSNNILKEEVPIFLKIKGISVPFFIKELKLSQNNAIVKLKFIDSENYALRFKSCPVYIVADNILNKKDDYEFDFELYDYDVYDDVYGYIGKIKDINLIPGNPVLEIDLDGKAIIIPYSEEFIKEICHDTKKVKIKSPEGLIDLYLK